MRQTVEQIDANAQFNESAELGFGSLLIAEDDDGGYDPVGVVTTIREARELATEDFRSRIADLENGGGPLCLASYAIWVRRFNGYEVLRRVDP